jgi:hypothetical protein
MIESRFQRKGIKMMANARAMARGKFIGISRTMAAKVPYPEATKSI